MLFSTEANYHVPTYQGSQGLVTDRHAGSYPRFSIRECSNPRAVAPHFA